MVKPKTKGRQKSTRNADRAGGTSTGPHRMRTTKTNQEPADGWPLEARYLASQGAFVSYDTEGLTVAELLALRWEDFDERAGTLKIDESVSHLGGELEWNEPKTEMGLRVLPLAGEARMLL